MKGIIFNLLERVVADEYGEETWDALLANSHLEGAYTSLGSYDDGELLALVEAAAGKTGKPPADVIRWFGRKALPLLAERYPKFFEGHRSTRSFLLTLNDIIHPEVRKLYPGAHVPEFEFDDSDPSVLRLAYRSEKRLCALAEGLILGAGDHFREAIVIEQPECMLQGDKRCLLVCRFGEARS